MTSSMVHHELITTLSTALQQHLTQFPHSTPFIIGVACSGGLDSMCLADALIQITQTPSIHLPLFTPMIFTVDHRLHQHSEAWAHGVTQYWNSRGVKAQHLYADQELIRAGQGIEDGARRARYQALEEAAQMNHCDLILLAHHASDQVETLLMRLQGPTGIQGLGGIPERRGLFLRPWLNQEHTTLKAYAQTRSLPIFEDPSNHDLRWLRNRIRTHILPTLEHSFEPHWAQRIAQSATHVREATQGSHWFLQQVLEGTMVANQHRITFTWPQGLTAPKEAQRLALLTVWKATWKLLNPHHSDRRRLHDHLTPLQSLWQGHALSQHQLPQGLWAWGARGKLTIDSLISQLECPNIDSLALIVAPEVSVLWGVWKLTISLAHDGERDPHSIPLSRAPLPWRLRLPTSGEKFHLLGAPGSKGIRQLWARAHVCPLERTLLPVLVDGDDVPIWLPYLRPADHIRGGAGTRWVIEWTLQQDLMPLDFIVPD